MLLTIASAPISSNPVSGQLPDYRHNRSSYVIQQVSAIAIFVSYGDFESTVGL
jgi:hypothetical protein